MKHEHICSFFSVLGASFLKAHGLDPEVAESATERFSSAVWLPSLVLYFAITILKSSPLGFLAHDTLWNVLQFGPILVTSAMLLFPLGWRSTTRRQKLIVWAAAGFVVSVSISLVGSIHLPTSAAQFLILILMLGFVLLTFARRWNGRLRIERDLLSVFALISVNQLIGVAGAAFGAHWAIGDFYRFTGTTNNANFAGMLSAIGLAIGVPLFVRADLRARIVIGVAGAVLLLSLLLSGSRGSMVAVGVGVLLFLTTQRYWRTLLSVSIGLVVGAAGLFILVPGVLNRVSEGDLTSGRVGLYATVLNHWLEHPVAGIGFRTTQTIDGTSGLEAHNIFLSVLLETGALGLIGFLFLLGSIFYVGRANPLAGAAVTVVVMELTESSLFGWGAPTALFSWIVLLAYAKLGQFSAEPPIRPLTLRRVAPEVAV
ncbi:O-antigen ligase [Conyzicola nivalis]|uniref:O-antigen ligase n=1 Tax=Conyzicola nivalis TaxID=1477021 RepID=A0ABV2QSG0_9MICO